MNKYKVGDKVKVIYEPMKEKYNKVYEIEKVLIDNNGEAIYKLKGIKSYATESMIENYLGVEIKPFKVDTSIKVGDITYVGIGVDKE